MCLGLKFSSVRSIEGVVAGRFNDFGTNGGPTAKSLKPKFDIFSKLVSAQTGVQIPDVEIKYLVAAAIAMKGLGSLLFVFGSSLGAYLLPLNQAITTPILYDFYNHDADKPEFAQLFVKFTQAELGIVGGIVLLHWNDELNAEKEQEEGSQN